MKESLAEDKKEVPKRPELKIVKDLISSKLDRPLAKKSKNQRKKEQKRLSRCSSEINWRFAKRY